MIAAVSILSKGDEIIRIYIRRRPFMKTRGSRQHDVGTAIDALFWSHGGRYRVSPGSNLKVSDRVQALISGPFYDKAAEK